MLKWNNERREDWKMFKEYRLLRGYTQEKLAELTNIDTRNIQRIENENHLPNIVSFAKLVFALQISNEDIIKYLKAVSKES